MDENEAKKILDEVMDYLWKKVLAKVAEGYSYKDATIIVMQETMSDNEVKE